MRLALLLLLITFAPIITANERWFDVELVIFSHETPLSRLNEIGLNNFSPPDLHAARPLLPPTDNATALLPYSQIADTALQLTASAEKLRTSRGYRLLHHIGWRQPGVARENAVAVRIQSPALSQSSIVENHGNSQRHIDGTARLSLSRFLHLELDLTFNNQPLTTAPGAPHSVVARTTTPIYLQGVALQPTQRYLIRESRRMRSREIHYFDHPAFGIIATITPSDGIAPPSDTP
jgi:hypothetical protein